MGNQYSITVSDESDRILQMAKERGYKVSQIIDAGIKALQIDALTRAVKHDRALKAFYDGKTVDDFLGDDQ